MDNEIQFRRNDIFVLAGLIIFTLLYALRYVNFSIHPFEDAAILMRYAQHFAQGYGIVWNIGEPPVDGATDFLFLVVVGGLNKAGMSVESAVRSVGIIAHLTNVCLLYLLFRKIQRSGIWIALISSAYLACGPGLQYIAAYFGTPLFALSVSMSWYYALKIIQHDTVSTFDNSLFVISCFLSGLIRPEGVLLGLFILAGIVYAKGFEQSRTIILSFIVFFLICGGGYFLWRWNYFGYPLPNPFYKKGGGLLYWKSFRLSLSNVFYLTFPFGIFLLASLFYKIFYIIQHTIRSKQHIFNQIGSEVLSKKAVAPLIPICAFASVWILLSDEMNYGMRFQYIILPLVLASWYPIMREMLSHIKSPTLIMIFSNNRLFFHSTCMAILCSLLLYQYRNTSVFNYSKDGRYTIARILSEYKNKNYTIATSEAGIIPLYSGWHTVDTWGLNDPWIAHHGLITEEYVRRYQPEIIMFHANFSPVVPARCNGAFDEMGLRLKNYAEHNMYFLAASFGVSPHVTHYYFVREGFEDSQTLIKRIQAVRYTWWMTGELCINYAILNYGREFQH
jgi:hypothetical protein